LSRVLVRSPVPTAVEAVGWRVAARDAWQALWVSRALVWAAGLLAVVIFGVLPDRAGPLDPLDRTEPFGPLGNLLVAPGARWDARWYLAIAELGYDQSTRTAFFPLYPLLVAVGGALTGSPVVAGIAISCAALFVALTVLHRLVVLELGVEVARPALLYIAFFPAAVFFSAVYTEALYLALSVGAVYAARRGNWAVAGLLGALASSTRSIGFLILVPLALLYLYGPRGDRPGRGLGGGLRPRHPLRADAAWLLLVPAGLVGYLAYLGITMGDPLSPFHVQSEWQREFAGPLGAVWEGAVAAFAGLRQLMSFSREPVYYPAAVGDPLVVAVRHLVLFAFLAFAAVATIGTFRRLPAAYGAYVVAALAVPLSTPAAGQPLLSLPRFMAVLFPLHMWLAAWAVERGRRRAVLGVLGAGLVAWSALFSTWVWAA
jgi:hypothetical protein